MTSSSGYLGVYLMASKRYQAVIWDSGVNKYIGTYDNAKQAANAYDAAGIKLGRSLSKLNFPNKVPRGYTPTKKNLSSNNTSGYRGVCKTKSGWKAQITVESEQHNLGHFNTCKQAAIAHDYALRKYAQPVSLLNFPTMKHDLDMEPKRKKRKYKIGKTGYLGVTKYGKKYKAMISINSVQTYLGVFDTAEKAAAVYNQAAHKRAMRAKKKEEKEEKESIRSTLTSATLYGAKSIKNCKKKSRDVQQKKKKSKRREKSKKSKKKTERRMQGLMELAGRTHFHDNMFDRQ